MAADGCSSIGVEEEAALTIPEIIHKAISDRAFPGAAVAFGSAEECFIQSFGHHTYESTASVSEDSIWDLASLTKVMATVPAVMLLHERGLIDLDFPACHYLPSFGCGGKHAVTIRQLLTHTAGLRECYPLSILGPTSSSQVIDFILKDKPPYPPAASAHYSDFSMIVLGWVVERVTAVPLDVFAAQEIFQPLGLLHTSFRRSIPPPLSLHSSPRSLPSPSLVNVVPTEVDTLHRQRLLWGEVHDPTAWLLGGVAGHAGLFSTVADVAKFAQILLQLAGGGSSSTSSSTSSSSSSSSSSGGGGGGGSSGGSSSSCMGAGKDGGTSLADRKSREQGSSGMNLEPNDAKVASGYLQDNSMRSTNYKKPLFKPATVRLFTTAVEPSAANPKPFALGWDVASRTGRENYSSAGPLLSRQSFGHTGFTGTSMWIDAQQNIFIVLLTNAVHPVAFSYCSHDDSKWSIRDVRPRVAAAAARVMLDRMKSMKGVAWQMGSRVTSLECWQAQDEVEIFHMCSNQGDGVRCNERSSDAKMEKIVCCKEKSFVKRAIFGSIAFLIIACLQL